MSVKKLARLALLAAAALILFAAEAQLPPPVPIPGVKLGLSNVFVLLALSLYGRREAALVLALKTLLGAAVAGTLLSFAYSAAGGLCCFTLMALLKGRVTEKQLWFLSAAGALGHNFGQLALAVLLLGAPGLWWYAPVLVLSGVVTGVFTGLCARAALPPLRKTLFK